MASSQVSGARVAAVAQVGEAVEIHRAFARARAQTCCPALGFPNGGGDSSGLTPAAPAIMWVHDSRFLQAPKEVHGAGDLGGQARERPGRLSDRRGRHTTGKWR